MDHTVDADRVNANVRMVGWVIDAIFFLATIDVKNTVNVKMVHAFVLRDGMENIARYVRIYQQTNKKPVCLLLKITNFFYFSLQPDVRMLVPDMVCVL